MDGPTVPFGCNLQVSVSNESLTYWRTSWTHGGRGHQLDHSKKQQEVPSETGRGARRKNLPHAKRIFFLYTSSNKEAKRLCCQIKGRKCRKHAVSLVSSWLLPERAININVLQVRTISITHSQKRTLASGKVCGNLSFLRHFR